MDYTSPSNYEVELNGPFPYRDADTLSSYKYDLPQLPTARVDTNLLRLSEPLHLKSDRQFKMEGWFTGLDINFYPTFIAILTLIADGLYWLTTRNAMSLTIKWRNMKKIQC